MKIDIEVDLKSARLVFHGSIASVLVVNPCESERYDVHAVPLTRFYDDTGSDGDWFAFWEEDCHAPPVYILRADSFESAYEVFCEEFVHPLDEDTLKDYERTPEGDYEGLTLTSRGWISTESIQGHEIELKAVTL
jgi:hypothetical protein